MRKTFKYRLNPTPAQERAMRATLDECCWLYNHLLEQRKAAYYEECGDTLTLYEQQATFVALKAARPSLAAPYSQVLQVSVNPSYTSRTCSRCGHRARKELAERVHRCCCRGLVLDGDQNAALNILALGLQSLA